MGRLATKDYYRLTDIRHAVFLLQESLLWHLKVLLHLLPELNQAIPIKLLRSELRF